MLVRLFSIVIIVLALASSVWGSNSLINATYDLLDQHYLVQFTLYNTLQQEKLTSLVIGAYNAENLRSPSEWTGAYSYGEVLWCATTLQSQLQPGQSMGGFGFTMQNSPGTLYWSIRSDKNNYTGFIAPTPVPEPSSILALFGGLVGVGGFALRRRK